jgi:hypothetical protein
MRVSLVKEPHLLFGGGHNAKSCYTPNPDGTVPEWVLRQRRYNNGARVSQEWGYYLRNNDLRELQEYYRHG